ncbi:MAG: SseB family protein [Clostridia bacterium]|nr:SseB family protein [Clostridia bacterium]
MASFVDKLRAMVGMGPKAGERKASGAGSASAFHRLSGEYLACRDEPQKLVLFQQMCKALPDTLFLCAMCFEGENPNVPARDKELHASVGAERLYEAQQGVVTKGNPGYRLTSKKDKRRMHLRTLVYQKTKEEWVPLFTDFTEYLPVFGQNSRVAVISFKEAHQLARANKGIIINPGRDAIRLDNDQLKKVL